MSEEKTADISKLKSAGTPERVNFQNNKAVEKESGINPENPADGDGAGNGSGAAAATPPVITDEMLTGLTDDQLKSILNGKGIEFDDFEGLKTKLTAATTTSVEPTAEQKAEQEKAFEKRMLDFHISNGGTAEEFVALKQVASMDLKTLSAAALQKGLKAEGFTEEEIAVVLKERYYQLNPDELQRDEEEAEEDFNKRKEFLKKKVGYGSKKLENHAFHTKQNAGDHLKELRQAILDIDAANKSETEFSSKIDEVSKKIPREITFELGEINDKKVDPVKFKVSENDIAEVTNLLKDKAQRETILYNPDKTLNLSKVMEMMLRNKYLESAVKVAYIDGGSRQVGMVKQIFPDSPYALGVGGGAQSSASGGTKGNFTKAGKPERVRPNN